MSEPAGFDGFVEARSGVLLRAAWLLTGDWQEAEDLLQTALAKAYLAWQRIEPGREEGYVRRVIFTTYATWWRRAWRGEQPVAVLEEREVRDLSGQVELREVVLTALAQLPRRQRATVVLRYYCDLSVDETADALGCSVGTVKSQAAKGLARLRASGLADALQEGSLS